MIVIPVKRIKSMKLVLLNYHIMPSLLCNLLNLRESWWPKGPLVTVVLDLWNFGHLCSNKNKTHLKNDVRLLNTHTSALIIDDYAKDGGSGAV